MLKFVKWLILSLLFVLNLPVNQVKAEIGKTEKEEIYPDLNNHGNFQSPNIFKLFSVYYCIRDIVKFIRHFIVPPSNYTTFPCLTGRKQRITMSTPFKGF